MPAAVVVAERRAAVSSRPPVDTSFADLYAELAPKLRKLVAARADVPESVLDDACQMAWAALLADPTAVDPPRRLGWLLTTARREAIELMRRANRDLAFDEALTAPAPASLDGGSPERATEFWEEMRRLRRLPRRQRELVWLRSLGYGYAEIAARTGLTERTVERQLGLAQRTLREAA